MADEVGRLQSALPAHYVIERELGRGGMATVYLADDRRHHRKVALKVLLPELASVVGRTRFLREIEIEASLSHPGIVPLFDSGATDDFVYYVMPYVEGESLRDRIDRERQLPLDDALRIARDVGEALSHAHGRGVVHRDVKPANILLSGGRALVTDFGIARAVTAAGGEQITSSGLAVGTPAYMSPEQAAARDPVDQRADVYALGCVVYEMLAGDPPFTGATAQAVMARARLESPPSLEVVRPGVGVGVQRVVDKALAKAPADRWQTVSEFVGALERAAVSPEPGEYPAPRRGRRRWWAAVGAVLVVGATLAIWKPWAPAVRLDPNKVMGFPLRTQGGATRGDAELVLQGIANALIHTEPLRWLDSWADLTPAQREDPGRVPADAMRRLTLGRGARYFVTGVVTQVGDSQAVALELYDAKADSFLAREVAGGRAGAALLGLRAINELLPRLVGRSTHVEEAWLSGRNPGAVASWLQGEVAYRHARYQEAMRSYRRALAEDSGLIVAALKGAVTAAWINAYPEADSLVRLALRHEQEMPARNARMARGLRFFFQGDGDSALAWFQSARDADPGWSEGWYAVGEAYFHLVPSGMGLDSLAEVAFAKAVSLDSTFAPPLFHLAEIRLGRGDLAAGRGLAAAYARASEDPGQRDQLSRMALCLERGPGAADWRAAVRGGRADEALDAARLFAAGMRQPACALAAYEAVAHGDSVGDPDRWSAIKGLFFLYVARGDTARVVQFADSLVEHGPLWAAPIMIWGAILGLLPAEKAEAVLNPYAVSLDSMQQGRLSVFSAWYVHRGDRARMDSILLLSRARSDTSAAWHAWADAMAAQLALLKGDSGAAMRLLRSLRVVADVPSLSWGFVEPRAAERMQLVRLLMARGDAEEALRRAAEFDRAVPANLAFLRESLALRARAAESLGRERETRGYRARLSLLAGR